MSMLAALKGCYDRLAEDQDSGIAPFGYSEENISFALVLSSAGTLVGQPTDLRIQSGKRLAPRRMLVPQSFKRPGITPRSFFLWDKVSYALGVGQRPKDRTEAEHRKRLAVEHDAFKAFHARALAASDDEGLEALLAFLECWAPEQIYALDHKDDLLQNPNLVFRLDGERRYLHQRPTARALWARLLAEGSGAEGLCLISGERCAARAPAPVDQGRAWRPVERRLDRVLQPRRLHFLRQGTGQERAGLRGGGVRLHDRPQPPPAPGQPQPRPDRRRLDRVLGREPRRRPRRSWSGRCSNRPPRAKPTPTSARRGSMPARRRSFETYSTRSRRAGRFATRHRNSERVRASSSLAWPRMPPASPSVSGTRTRWATSPAASASTTRTSRSSRRPWRARAGHLAAALRDRRPAQGREHPRPPRRRGHARDPHRRRYPRALLAAVVMRMRAGWRRSNGMRAAICKACLDRDAR